MIDKHQILSLFVMLGYFYYKGFIQKIRNIIKMYIQRKIFSYIQVCFISTSGTFFMMSAGFIVIRFFFYALSKYQCRLFSKKSIIINQQKESVMSWQQTQTSQVKQNQKLIQDQNYSNETFFMMLSSLESTVQHFKNSKHDFNNKMFKGYDRVNYSSKSLIQLMSQLKTHIFLFQASKMAWKMENRNQKWRLPKNYNQTDALKFVRKAREIFQQSSDENSINCQKMTDDIENLIKNDVAKNLYIENMNFKMDYSSEDKAKIQKSILKNGLQANQWMIEQGQNANKFNDRSQLRAKINYPQNSNNSIQNSSNFNKSNTSKPEQIKNNSKIQDQHLRGSKAQENDTCHYILSSKYVSDKISQFLKKNSLKQLKSNCTFNSHYSYCKDTENLRRESQIYRSYTTVISIKIIKGSFQTLPQQPVQKLLKEHSNNLKPGQIKNHSKIYNYNLRGSKHQQEYIYHYILSSKTVSQEISQFLKKRSLEQLYQSQGFYGRYKYCTEAEDLKIESIRQKSYTTVTPIKIYQERFQAFPQQSVQQLLKKPSIIK